MCRFDRSGECEYSAEDRGRRLVGADQTAAAALAGEVAGPAAGDGPAVPAGHPPRPHSLATPAAGARVRRVHRQRGRLHRRALCEGLADRAPPCGITYLRSSGDGTFKLQAAVIREITWTGTGGDLPDGTFGNDQAVTVQETKPSTAED